MSKKSRVSIIIPCYNEEKHIASCLDSVLNNDYPEELLEIFVVDGMSEDNTRAILDDYSERYHVINFLDNPHKIVPYALNLAIKKATGKYIIRMDAHSSYPTDYVSTLIHYHQKLNADNVGGVWDIMPDNNGIVAKANAWATSSVFGIGNASYRLRNKEIKKVDTVPFGCYKRVLFEKIGYFDTDLKRNQDDEFNARLIQSGGKIYLLPFLKIKYTARPDLYRLSKMFYQYALYKPLVNRKLNHPATLRQFIPPAFVLYLLIWIFSLVFSFYPWLISVPVIGYLILNLAFSLKESIKNNDPASALVLPVVFLSIHLSYGVGYFVGIFRFKVFFD